MFPLYQAIIYIMHFLAIVIVLKDLGTLCEQLEEFILIFGPKETKLTKICYGKILCHGNKIIMLWDNYVIGTRSFLWELDIVLWECDLMSW